MPAKTRIVKFKSDMTKPDVAKRLARQSRTSVGKAADRLDLMVNELLRTLREGREARLPWVGSFTPGKRGEVAFEAEPKRRS